MRPSFERLLPHRAPMLMLTEMLAQDADQVQCRSVIAADNPLLHDGVLPATAAVELLAQAAGTLLGLRAVAKAGQPGAIVQIKSFQLEPVGIAVGAELTIVARYQAGTADAAVFDGEVSMGEQIFFRATLMIAFLPDKQS